MNQPVEFVNRYRVQNSLERRLTCVVRSDAVFYNPPCSLADPCAAPGTIRARNALPAMENANKNVAALALQRGRCCSLDQEPGL
jgi:hypothetical protein